MRHLTVTPTIGSLAEELSGRVEDSEGVDLYWLGQAGFVMRLRNSLVVIDPYLSDYLARKYRGHEFSHERMMPAPIEAGRLVPIRIILCTHRHSDHMDPESLSELARRSPLCTVIVPAPELAHAESLGVEKSQLRGLVVGERAVVSGSSDERSAHAEGGERGRSGAVESVTVTVEAIPAAHEELIVSERGESACLGYIISTNGLTIYHSGDCIPYPGLVEQLRERQIDLALLPINGRSVHLRERGIAGNFTVAEAIDLCDQAEIPFMIGHHFGMFAFNSVLRAEAQDAISARNGRVHCDLADIDRCWRLRGQAQRSGTNRQ